MTIVRCQNLHCHHLAMPGPFSITITQPPHWMRPLFSSPSSKPIYMLWQLVTGPHCHCWLMPSFKNGCTAIAIIGACTFSTVIGTKSSSTIVGATKLYHSRLVPVPPVSSMPLLAAPLLLPVPSAPSLGACTFSTIGACTFSTIIGVKSSSNIMLKALQHHCQCQTSMNVLYFFDLYHKMVEEIYFPMKRAWGSLVQKGDCRSNHELLPYLVPLF